MLNLQTILISITLLSHVKPAVYMHALKCIFMLNLQFVFMPNLQFLFMFNQQFIFILNQSVHSNPSYHVKLIPLITLVLLHLSLYNVTPISFILTPHIMLNQYL